MFEYAYIEKHELDNETVPVYKYNLDKMDFGILKLKTKKNDNMKIEPLNMYIHFTIDYSGSMNEHTKPYDTKLDVVLQTVKDIIHFLATKCRNDENMSIYFGIDSFNNEYCELFSKRKIPTTEYEIFMFESEFKNKNKAFGDTNIELALTESTKKINAYKVENPTHKILHFFLTDGHPTRGELSNTLLSKFVNKNVSTVYMGYGREHNSKLLQCLSQQSSIGSSYEYIHDFEKITDVCGEVLHKYLYSCLNSFSLKCNGCLIYDSKTNTWVTELYEGTCSYEQELVYSILLENGDIESPVLSSVDIIENGVILSTPLIDNQTNLSVYIFRQQVIEILKLVGDYDDTSDYDKFKEYKSNMNELFRKMRGYMKTDVCIEDDKKMLNVLCDDLYISYMTIGTDLGNMCTISRQTTHSRQTSYRIHLDVDELTQPYIYDKNASQISRSQSYYSDHDSDHDSHSQSDSFLENLNEIQDKETQVLEYEEEHDIQTYNYQATQDLLYSPNIRRTICEIHRNT
jgi:hypothetical protein